MKYAQLVWTGSPLYMNALETMELTKKQQEKVQVCEKQPGNNNRGK